MQGTEFTWTSEDGLNLFAKSYGTESAPLTVLCLHGLTRNHKDFEAMIAALPARYRYIAVDVRGRGQSDYDPNPKNYAPPVYAKDMQRLIDTLGLKRVALIGTSMGGLISILMIRSAPGRIAGIVLNDVGPAVEKAGLARIAAYAGKMPPVTDWASAAAAVKTVNGPIFPHYTDDQWMAIARRTYREMPDGRVQPDYDPNIAANLGKMKPGPLTSFFLWRIFGVTKKAPLLVVRGETSDILSQATAELMVKRHPDARLARVPGIGHAPFLDEPEAVTAITEFLSRLETTA